MEFRPARALPCRLRLARAFTWACRSAAAGTAFESSASRDERRARCRVLAEAAAGCRRISKGAKHYWNDVGCPPVRQLGAPALFCAYRTAPCTTLLLGRICSAYLSPTRASINYTRWFCSSGRFRGCVMIRRRARVHLCHERSHRLAARVFETTALVRRAARSASLAACLQAVAIDGDTTGGATPAIRPLAPLSSNQATT